ncbi:MAG: galactokinase [Bacteroidales bacterium]|nr:galactokinase [Bacteroidales bacterium]
MDITMLKKKFINRYGQSKEESGIYFAPGRVNLIGEHTDYNGGYVFPCAINFGTYLAIRKNNDNLVRMASMNFDYTAAVTPEEIQQKHEGQWVNYPLGVLNEFRKLGIAITGMDMLFYGNVPNGAGLSSSASIEIATALAINELYYAELDGIALAQLGQRAENLFVGVNCGIMDQFASAMGKKDSALFLDCNTLEYKIVPLNLNGYKLLITNTNKRRGLADSKYNERRSECEQAVEYIRKVKDIKLLGEITESEFYLIEKHIPDENVKKRARHVVTEIKRTVDAVEALNAGDLEKFGALMNGSHDSLRDDYEVTGPELDTLVEEARKVLGVIGSRMTGAGFGGCTVSLVDEKQVNTVIQKVGKNYTIRTGLKADFYVAGIGDGAKLIERF